MTYHNIDPLFDEASEVLILGSFPSVRSRQMQFFYGHPQNRFWKVLAASLAWDHVPQTVEEKKAFLHQSHIALWDVIAACEITGSSDSSIRNVQPTDLRRIIDPAPIRLILCNGSKSYQLYQKYHENVLNRPALCLPSTSPANAAWTLERLTDAWGKVLSCPNSEILIREEFQS